MKPELIDALVRGVCIEAKYPLLFAMSITSSTANKSTEQILCKQLQLGSVVHTIDDSVTLLITTDCKVSVIDRVISVTGICISTGVEMSVALWRVRCITDCFEEEGSPWITCAHGKQYITWSGWWNDEAVQCWETKDGSDVCICYNEVIIRSEHSRCVIGLSQFKTRAFCCSDVEKTLQTLRSLRVGDVIETARLLPRSNGSGGKPKLDVIFNIPRGQQLKCTAHCLLDWNKWTPSPHHCGVKHTRSCSSERIIIRTERNREEELSLGVVCQSDFTIVHSGDEHYGDVDDSLSMYLGRYSFMRRDPCRHLFKITKTLLIQPHTRYLRLTSTSNPHIEFMVLEEQLKNEFYTRQDLCDVQSRRLKLMKQCENNLKTLEPGDSVKITTHTEFVNIVAMIKKENGEYLYKYKRGTEFITIDMSNVASIVKATDIDTLKLYKPPIELHVGDLVFLSTVDEESRTTVESHYISRIVEDPEAVVLCSRTEQGDEMYLLEHSPGRILGVTNLHTILDRSKNVIESIEERQTKRRRLNSNVKNNK